MKCLCKVEKMCIYGHKAICLEMLQQEILKPPLNDGLLADSFSHHWSSYCYIQERLKALLGFEC